MFWPRDYKNANMTALCDASQDFHFRHDERRVKNKGKPAGSRHLFFASAIRQKRPCISYAKSKATWGHEKRTDGIQRCFLHALPARRVRLEDLLTSKFRTFRSEYNLQLAAGFEVQYTRASFTCLESASAMDLSKQSSSRDSSRLVASQWHCTFCRRPVKMTIEWADAIVALTEQIGRTRVSTACLSSTCPVEMRLKCRAMRLTANWLLSEEDSHVTNSRVTNCASSSKLERETKWNCARITLHCYVKRVYLSLVEKDSNSSGRLALASRASQSLSVLFCIKTPKLLCFEREASSVCQWINL